MSAQVLFYLSPYNLCAVSPSSAIAPPTLDDNEAMSDVRQMWPSTSHIFPPLSPPELVSVTGMLGEM